MPESEELAPEKTENNLLETEETISPDTQEIGLAEAEEEMLAKTEETELEHVAPLKKESQKNEEATNQDKEVSNAGAPLLQRESAEPATPQELSSQAGLAIEISFELDHQRLPLTRIRTLTEGEVITLGGADFKATLLLQEKAIAEAQLVMVEGRPSVQITKIFTAASLA